MEKIFGHSILSLEQATELLKRYGSPLYVYDADVIKHKASFISKVAQGFHIAYAMKANSNSQILKLLQQHGVPNVDVVSPGEIFKALQCGYKPNQILYTQNFMSEEQLDYALSQGVILNIGALDTLRNFKEKLRHQKIFVRINPELGAGETYQVVTGGPKSKFGIYFDQIDEVIKIAAENQIHIVGLHQHIGSNLKRKDENVFVETVKYIFQMSNKFPEIEYINIGGGIGISYRPQQQSMDVESLYNQVRQIRNRHYELTGKDIQIWIEPGRFLVGDSGILLCKLTAKKRTPERIFYGTDTGFNHLIRPALYGSHHEIYNLSRPNYEKQVVTVCGNICQCSDNFGNNINIGGQIGDILCFQNVGAYGFSMSSNYNERLKPAEILKQNENFRVIRRKQTYQDLMQKI